MSSEESVQMILKSCRISYKLWDSEKFLMEYRQIPVEILTYFCLHSHMIETGQTSDEFQVQFQTKSKRNFGKFIT